MTIVTPSYHVTPTPDKPDGLIPLPDGTIFMFGYTREITYGGDKPPFPFPLNYFLTPELALERACKYFGSTLQPKFEKHAGTTVASFDIYKIIDLNGVPMFIYVWAITPMGGVA